MHHSPLKVEVKRNGLAESYHEVYAVAVDITGSVKLEFGSPALEIFPRSCVKPLQALPLFFTGAADEFRITSEELALACASHCGETEHTFFISSWLQRLGLGEKNLACGVHPPYHQPTAFDLVRKGEEFSQIHNNCSGKHTGMLCQALCRCEPLEGYISIDHPIQQRVHQILELFYDCSLKQHGIDGCGIPTFLVPLFNLALAFARFVDFSEKAKYGSFCQRLYNAAISHPSLIAGSEKYCTMMMRELRGQALVKVGAEGVFIAAIPHLKMGIAVKCLDGNARASELALSFIFKKLGLLSESSLFLRPQLKNWGGANVGSLELKLQ